MRTAAPCSITARRRSSVPSTRPAANSTASSVNPSAEPSSYPQIPRTRLKEKEIAGSGQDLEIWLPRYVFAHRPLVNRVAGQTDPRLLYMLRAAGQLGIGAVPSPGMTDTWLSVNQLGPVAFPARQPGSLAAITRGRTDGRPLLNVTCGWRVGPAFQGCS